MTLISQRLKLFLVANMCRTDITNGFTREELC